MKQTEEKVKGGRKRTHLVKVYLNDAEYFPTLLTESF